MLPREDVTDVAYVEPATDPERTVALLFSEIMNVAPVGATDSLVELGGTSLDLTHVAGRLRADYGEVDGLIDVLRIGTVGDIAADLPFPP